MADYFVLNESEFKYAYDDYKSQCHEDDRLRKGVMFSVHRFHGRALRRFRAKQAGHVLTKQNLWSEFSNPKKPETPAAAAATATPAVPAVPKPKRARKKGIPKPEVSDIKGAFRKFIAHQQGNRCCYCRRWLFNSGYSKPIEHILPRESYEQYSFHFWNLSVACVDCNTIKSDNVWTDTIRRDLEAYPSPNSFTDMFHPRFHRFDDHIRFIRVQTNDHSVTLYRGITPQGEKLCELLLNTIAGKEVIEAANQTLKSSMETIERFEVEEGSELEAALKSLHEALSGRTIELVQR